MSNHSCLSIPTKALWVVARTFFQRKVPSAALVMQEGSGERRKLHVRRARGEMDLPRVPADEGSELWPPQGGQQAKEMRASEEGEWLAWAPPAVTRRGRSAFGGHRRVLSNGCTNSPLLKQVVAKSSTIPSQALPARTA